MKHKKNLKKDELAERIKQEYASDVYSAMAAYAFWRQLVRDKKPRSRPVKLTATSSTERMIANLKLGIKLDHIRFVEHGIRPLDGNYRKYKKELIDL